MSLDRPRLILAACLAAALASVGFADHHARPAGATTTGPAAGDVAVLRVGDRLDQDRLHQITRPGLYGMSQPPAGSRYGVVDGRLIRYDPEKAQLLSIIRQVDRILD